MIEQQKAEAYVRSQIPELMELSFGCEVLPLLGDIIQFASPTIYVGYEYRADETGDELWECFKNSSCGEPQWYRKIHIGYQIIGHPIQLQHWLRVLLNAEKKPRRFGKKTGMCEFEETQVDYDGDTFQVILRYKEGGCRCSYDCADRHSLIITFNLTKGQPATEADYKAFCGIVGA